MSVKYPFCKIFEIDSIQLLVRKCTNGQDFYIEWSSCIDKNFVYIVSDPLNDEELDNYFNNVDYSEGDNMLREMRNRLEGENEKH